jgi:ubiquinone/menaquinone biosynthesis C-methylase UbiE
MISEVRLLEQAQTEAFDTEYVDDNLFSIVSKNMDRHFHREEKIPMMDVGGGNGRFSDKILTHYPNAEITVLEPEATLLEKNAYHKNKTLCSSTFQDYPEDNNTFDIIEFNWVLHHFVSHSYASTYDLQMRSLEKAYQLLKPGGVVVIFENFYEGFIDNDIPGNVIYHLTSSSVLKKLTKHLGANTAGVGVCFHSQKKWINMIKDVGFEIDSAQHCYDFGNLSIVKQLALGISKQYVGIILGKKPK